MVPYITELKQKIDSGVLTPQNTSGPMFYEKVITDCLKHIKSAPGALVESYSEVDFQPLVELFDYIYSRGFPVQTDFGGQSWSNTLHSVCTYTQSLPVIKWFHTRGLKISQSSTVSDGGIGFLLEAVHAGVIPQEIDSRCLNYIYRFDSKSTRYSQGWSRQYTDTEQYLARQVQEVQLGLQHGLEFPFDFLYEAIYLPQSSLCDTPCFMSMYLNMFLTLVDMFQKHSETGRDLECKGPDLVLTVEHATYNRPIESENGKYYITQACNRYARIFLLSDPFGYKRKDSMDDNPYGYSASRGTVSPLLLKVIDTYLEMYRDHATEMYHKLEYEYKWYSKQLAKCAGQVIQKDIGMYLVPEYVA